ncbi:MAG: hypothetical protein CM1200mP22_23360 [Dehalococcoidia bacterium]|nr:MAG: hypothetical protein CM1200mP22_23360 [Dehalococcoidia bacterium]
MRRLPVGDGGLAIHVLSDLGGTPEKSYVEETELMAFDLFWDGPHYHYGPRKRTTASIGTGHWYRTILAGF